MKSVANQEILRRSLRQNAYRIGFVLVALLVWYLAGITLSHTVVPPIGSTLDEVWSLLTSSTFYGELWITVKRVLLSFVLAYVVAAAVGVAMGRSKKVEAFLEMFIIIGTSQPGLFVAMIILVALGLADSTAIVTLAYLAVPMIAINFWQGAADLDWRLGEMGDVFGYGPVSRMRHIILPQLIGPALAAARQGMGLIWKYVVMVEMIGLSDGVGYQVYNRFQLFDLKGVVAWTISFLIFVLLFEYIVIRAVERRVYRWRHTSVGSRRAGGAAQQDVNDQANALAL